MLTGSNDSTVKIWDLREKKCVKTYSGHKERISALDFSPDGCWFASGSDDGTVRVWDITKAKIVHEYKSHKSGIVDIKFHPDEYILATASENTVQMVNMAAFSRMNSLKITSSIQKLCFNDEYRDDSRLLVASATCIQSLKRVKMKNNALISDGKISIDWDEVNDAMILPSKKKCLIALSTRENHVRSWIVNLKKLTMINNDEGEAYDSEDSTVSPSITIEENDEEFMHHVRSENKSSYHDGRVKLSESVKLAAQKCGTTPRKKRKSSDSFRNHSVNTHDTKSVQEDLLRGAETENLESPSKDSSPRILKPKIESINKWISTRRSSPAKLNYEEFAPDLVHIDCLFSENGCPVPSGIFVP